MSLHLSPTEILEAFEDVFDQAIVFHGFTDYMRDYDVVIYATADPRTGVEPEHLRYRFRHCVRATVTTAVGHDVWPKSLDDRLTDHETGVDMDGYVWGVKWQALYPGMRLLKDSPDAAEWRDRLGTPMREVLIETNGHNINLVFSALEVASLEPGWSPFVVDKSGQDPAAGEDE